MSGTAPAPRSPDLLRKLAWVVLIATIGVIVSGDIVQATESGAGCGESWPRCDGSIIPSIDDAATGIEFTHRAATFVLSALVAALYLVASRALDAHHRIRRAVRWLVGFFVAEVIIGALLVAFGWVEDDASVGRVVADGLHVVNTFFLLAAAAFVVHYAAGGRRPSWRNPDPDRRAILAGLGVVVLIAVTGAINSLADTLFPADTVLEGVREEFGAAAPFLVRIRAVHPIVAILGGIAVFFVVRRITDATATGRAARLGRIVQYTVGAQFAIGILNLSLLTPLETQVLHLLAADLLWVLLLFFDWELASAPVQGSDATVAVVEAAR
jgi:cytochrome c oxidase assembly protein subunit 15